MSDYKGDGRNTETLMVVIPAMVVPRLIVMSRTVQRANKNVKREREGEFNLFYVRVVIHRGNAQVLDQCLRTYLPCHTTIV